MFIGLHELYQGRKVLSALFLGEREITFPLSLEKGEHESAGYKAAWKSNALLNDLIYWGVGLTWCPKQFASRNLEFKPNLMFFWKDLDSYKYVLDPSNPDEGHVSNTDKASNFLGTEFNIYFSKTFLRLFREGIIINPWVPVSHVGGIMTHIGNGIEDRFHIPGYPVCLFNG